MNTIYKIKWDAVKSIWVVCSELCTAFGKTRNVGITPAIVAGGLLLAAFQAEAVCDSSDSVSYICTGTGGFPVIINPGVNPAVDSVDDISVSVESDVNSDGYILIDNQVYDTNKKITVSSSGNLTTSAPFITSDNDGVGVDILNDLGYAPIRVMDYGSADIEVQQHDGVLDGNQAGMILGKYNAVGNAMGGSINFSQAESGVLRGGSTGLLVGNYSANSTSPITLSLSGDVIGYAENDIYSTYYFIFKDPVAPKTVFVGMPVIPSGVYVYNNNSFSDLNLTQYKGLIKGNTGIFVSSAAHINMTLSSQVEGIIRSGINVSTPDGNVNINQISGAILGAENGIIADTKNAFVTTQGVINGAANAGVSIKYSESFVNRPMEKHSGQIFISQESGVISGGKYGILLENLGANPAILNISGTIKALETSSFTEQLSRYYLSGSTAANGIIRTSTTNGYTESVVDGGTAIVIGSNAGEGADINLNSGADVSSAAGIAIRTGAGNERLTINRGATVSGDIVMGSGNDTLVINQGANINGVSLFDGGSSSKYTVTDVSITSIRTTGGGKPPTTESTTTNVLQEDLVANGSPYTNKIFFNGVTYANSASVIRNWQSVFADQADITFTGDASLVTGHGTNSDGSLRGLVLSSASLNAMAPVDITGDVHIDTASRFSHRNGGTITGDTVNAGQLIYDNNTRHELTINGNYISDGGSVYLNSQLYDDASLTDKLIVNGNTSGNTTMFIRNAGGTGAPTLEGIELVRVSGQSDGEFIQSGRLVAGAYDYFLKRGQGEKSNNWYLTSLIQPVTSEDIPEEPGTAAVRPEAGGYAANLHQANNLFNLRLHDRLGETQYTDIMTGEQKVTSMWLRNVAGHTNVSSGNGQLKTGSNRYVMQLGGDIAQWTNNGDDRYHLGLMAGYGHVKSSTGNRLSGNRATARADGYSAGVYGTYYANGAEKTGLYADSWVQYSWFDNSVKGDDLEEEKYRSKGVSASVEAGYTFLVNETTGSSGETTNRWYVQPKAQVTYSGVKMNSHTEQNGTRVSGRGEDNIQTRLGVKVYGLGHAAKDNGTDRDFQPFAEVNWLHNTRDAGVSMNGTTVSQSGTRDIGEIKMGIEGRLTKNTDMWFNVAQQVGSDSYTDTQGMLGIKVRF
ncbi:TPA: autotransporter outer membrane beta-barrel domain-containing protein [Morganella morganii]